MLSKFESPEEAPFAFKEFVYTPDPSELYREGKRYVREVLEGDITDPNLMKQAHEAVQNEYRVLYRNGLDLSDAAFKKLFFEMYKNDLEVQEQLLLKRDAEEREREDARMRAETNRDEW